MRLRLRRVSLFVALAAGVGVTAVAACSSPNPDPGRLPVTPAKESGTEEDTSIPIPPPDDSGPNPDSGGGGPGRVYAHTPDTLYLYEPVGGTLKIVGKFDCLDPTNSRDMVLDVAVDRTGAMFATTYDWVLTVDPITAKCVKLKIPIVSDPDSPGSLLDTPNGLSFVPAGTVDPGKEALVGYSAPTSAAGGTVYYVRIDTTTGDMSVIGNMNASDAGAQYASSGDMIALINDANRAYVTVKLKTGGIPGGTDLLAEVDPKTGNVKRIIGDTNENNIYGLGYWAGKGYGFNDLGRILEINMTTGSAVVVKTLTDDAGTAQPWYGAGVTTQAPK